MAIPVGTKVRCIQIIHEEAIAGGIGQTYIVLDSGDEFGGWIKIIPNGPRCGAHRFEVVDEENPPEVAVLETRDVFLIVFDRGAGLETTSYTTEGAATRRVRSLRGAGAIIHSHKKIIVKLI